MTRHTNSKHRKATVDLLEDNEKSRLTFESLAGIVEAIKTSLCTDNLYGTELIAAVKIASCSKALFDAVLPLYEKFCRKKNQDRLLEEFYGLILDASTYLNCPHSHADNVIMIEIPDRLVAFFKLCQNRDEARTTTACDLKLDPVERGLLSYIVSKLYQKSRKSKNNCSEELNTLLQSLKSTESDNNFILARSRGGLVAPSHHLMGIVEEAEILFRKNIGEGEHVLRNIPVENICEKTRNSPVVKSLWENIVLESGIEESSSTHKLCLENIIKLYVWVRSFSYARDYITKYKIKEKYAKSKSLRKDLNRSKDN